MPKITPAGTPPSTLKAKTQTNTAQIIDIPKDAPMSIPKETAPTGQAVTNEVKASEAKPLPPQYDALAKKESALRTREQELKAQQASIDAKIQEAVNKALGEYKAKLKSNTLDVLGNDVGLTYDQLVEQALNQPDPKTRAIEQKIQSIEETQKRLEEESRKAATQQREQAVKQIRYDVQDLVESDPQFETIKGVGAVEDVVELITKTFDETGKLLSIDQAAKLVEEELFQEAVKIANLGKVKAKLQPQLTPEMVKQQTKQTITTLTNDMNASPKMSVRERAIAAMEGRLKR